MTPDDLVELRAIEELKYRYLRFLDLKQFDLLANTLTEDATASYGGGAHELEGRSAIIAFLETTMSRPEMLTTHKVHQPEIDLVDTDRARGVWALEDRVIDTEYGVTVSGAAYYEDEYRKVDGAWLISHTGYKRVYEELAPRPADVKLTASWWATGGRSQIGAGG